MMRRFWGFVEKKTFLVEKEIFIISGNTELSRFQPLYPRNITIHLIGLKIDLKFNLEKGEKRVICESRTEADS